MRVNQSLVTLLPDSGPGSGSVTSVGFSATVPTGLSASVSGSPITSAGTIALSLSFAAGYAIPTTIKQSNWDDAYTWVAAFPTQTGNSGKYLTTNGSSLSWATLDLSSITGTLPVTKGGTGVATLTGVVIGNGTSNFSAVTGGPNQILRVNGTATGYEFYTASFLTNPMTLNFDMIYQSGGVPARLAGNITTTKQFLTSIGNGTATTSLAWASFTNADVPGAALTSTNDTNVQITLGGTPSTAVLRATSITMGWTGQLAVGRGGTGASTLSGVLIGNATSAITGITGIGGQILRANPSTGVYEFWTPTYMQSPFTATAGQIIYSNSAGAPLALNPNSTANNMYLRSVSSGTPAWATIQGGDITGAALTETDDTNVTMTLGGTPANSLLRSVSMTLGWTGQLSVGRGGTGASTLTGILVGNGTSAVTTITGTAGQLLRRNLANTAYEFWTATYMGNPFTTGGDLVVSNSAGAPVRIPPNVTTTRKYLSQIGDGTSVVSTTWETVAGGGGLSGSGTTNYVAKWTGTSALGNSIINDDGSTVTVYGLLQTITSQAGAGTSLLYTANTDTTAGITHQSRFGTQQTGSGLARTLLYAASNTTGVTQGELTIVSENGGSVIANFGTSYTSNYALSLFNTGGTENVRIHTQGLTFIDGGDVRFGSSGFYYDSTNKRLGIGVATPSQALDVSSNFGIAKITSAVGTNATFFQFVNTGGNFFIGSEGSTGATFGATPYASVIRTPDTVPLEVFQGAWKAVELLTTGQFKWNDYTSSTSFSGTAAGYLAFTSTGSIITVPVPSGGGAPLYRVDFNSGVAETWGSMPSALSFFDGSTAFITAAELTNFTQVRFMVNKLGTAGNSGSILVLRYSTTYTQNVNLWSTIGTSSVQVSINVTNSFLETAWIDLVAGAKGDVFLSVLGSGGNGSISPVFGMITAEFR